MTIVYKTTSMIQLTTASTNPLYAVPHTGGWSESWWSLTDTITASRAAMTDCQNKRAALLPIQATIIGFRVQKYDMLGNQLRPMGSQLETIARPGRAGIMTDLPQAALQIIMVNTLNPNKANMILRGIPDQYITTGEFQPDSVYAGLLSQFRTAVAGGVFGFVGRDRSQASTRVLAASFADGILVDGIPATGVVAGNWVRLNRVFSNTGAPIVGPFRVASVVLNVIRVDGWPAGLIVDKPTGTLRRDQMAFFPYNNSYLRKATVKKVGSPFEKYRGRRSKRRV